MSGRPAFKDAGRFLGADGGLHQLACASGLALLAVWALATPARAATIQAGCTAGVGDVESLVKSLEQANTDPGADTVSLGAACTYTLREVDNRWFGPNGLPPITSTVTIEGNGATITREAGTSFRLLFVGSGAEAALTLQNLTLSKGIAAGGNSTGGGGGAGLGGAIFNRGHLTIESSTLTGNKASGGASGGVGLGRGGGGIGESAVAASGGGFGGPGPFLAVEGGKAGPEAEAGAGGAGLATGEDGKDAKQKTGGDGGGPATGTGGAGSGAEAGKGGDGSGGGGGGAGAAGSSGNGGKFGAGGAAASGASGAGGGGGVGGGGGAGGATSGGAGGGGFGGGGGQSSAGPGGAGGFGGGGGAGTSGAATGGFGGGEGGAGGGGGGGGMGGAIFNMQGEVTVLRSTIAGNGVVGGQSGHESGQGQAIGGAIFNLNGVVTSTGSTFADNEGANRASQIYSLVYDSSTPRTASVTLGDTIVSGGGGAEIEVASAKLEGDPGKAEADLSQFDLVRSNEAQGGELTPPALTADPLLGPLQANGGPTPTMALLPGSPAIDAGSSFGLTTDQRGPGFARPLNFAGVANAPGGDGSDIGAYEVQPICPGAAVPFAACPPPEQKSSPPPPTGTVEKPAGGGPGRPASPGTLSAVAQQKLASVVLVSFTCKAASCRVKITAKITYGKKHFSLALKTTTLKQAQKMRFRIPLSRKQRKLLSRALARHGRVTASVTADVTYSEGQARAGPIDIKVVR